MDKVSLRSESQYRLSLLTDQEKLKFSDSICEHIQSAAFLSDCSSIACYSALSSEPNLSSFFQFCFDIGKELYFPKFDLESQEYGLSSVSDLSDFELGAYKVLEPKNPISNPSIDLWLVPGVVFDLIGNRIGRGKGFYDRLLDGQSGIKCGISFHTQILHTPIPSNSHDQKMDILISDKQMYVTMGI